MATTTTSVWTLFFAVVVAAVAAPVFGAPSGGSAAGAFNFEVPDAIPEQFKDILPAELIAFHKGLTPEDKAALKKVAENHAKYENEDQALEALKAENEKLYEKAVELRKLVKDKIDALIPDAKAFVNSMIHKVRALKPKADEKPNLAAIRKEASELIEKYKALSDEAKESLKAQFPKIHSVILNEKFQKIAQGLLKPEGSAAAAPAA